jgi:amino acid adenylation domain-containing protein
MTDTLRASVLRGPAVAFRPVTVVHLFKEHATQWPDAPAVTDAGGSLTYGELDARSSRLALELQQNDIGWGVPVAIHVRRSAEAVIGLLGVLKAGGVAVMTDPDYPAERTHYMIADANAALVVVAENAGDPTPDFGRPTSPIPRADACTPAPGTALCPLEDSATAYIIYTSGSTGRPKGVAVTHASLSHSTQARFELYDAQPERFLLLSPFAFDSAFAGVFWTLCQGGTVAIPELLAPAALDGDTDPPTYTLCTPSFYASYLASQTGTAPRAFPQRVILAGETCPPEIVARHRAFAPGVRLFNEYGPTEACVWTTACDVTHHDGLATVPIGAPIANTDLLICGPDGNPVPVGVAGEIVIGGPGLASGYVGRPDDTAARFRRSPHTSTGRVYHTGDIGRIRPDGLVEHLGRSDAQLQVNGCRVEPGEVEAVLLSHPDVAGAGVTAVERHGGASLTAYVVPKTESIDYALIRAHLATRLPTFMIPTTLTSVPALPLLPSGKLDRAALPTLRPLGPPQPTEGAEPRDALHATLASIWERVLDVSGVGPTSNFFDLGGHSLLATRVVTQISRELGIPLTIRDVFEFPVLAAFTDRVRAGTNATAIANESVPASSAPPVRRGKAVQWST